MKISTNSWHFWLWKFTHHFTGKKDYQIEEPTSLWRYIWRLILMTPVTVFIFIVIGFLVICFGGTIIIGRNIYTILTLQGLSWFNLTDSDHRDEPAFKWLWEFKSINQGKIKWGLILEAFCGSWIIFIIGSAMSYYINSSNVLSVDTNNRGLFWILIILRQTILGFLWSTIYRFTKDKAIPSTIYYWRKIVPVVYFDEPGEDDSD